jgi:hypothetical protein
LDKLIVIVSGGAIGLIILAAASRGRRTRNTDARVSWRVGHVGRDSMYYEELRDGAWHRISIDGEMLTGVAHHVIYFSSIRFPDWAAGRREEIIERIKSSFHPPDYEYYEA